MRAHHPDVDTGQQGRVRVEGEDLVRGLQEHCLPAGTVVAPLVVDDVAPRQSQPARDALDVCFIQWPAALQWGSGEGEHISRATDAHEPGTALLHDDVGARLATCLEPGVAGAEGGMPCEGELPARAEDPDAVVGCISRGRKQESRLREIRPTGEGMHLVRRDSFGLVHDGHGIPEEGGSCEDVDLAEGAGFHDRTLATASSALSRHDGGPGDHRLQALRSRSGIPSAL